MMLLLAGSTHSMEVYRTATAKEGPPETKAKWGNPIAQDTAATAVVAELARKVCMQV